MWHIEDREFWIESYDGKKHKKQAYRPEYTKVLANFAKNDVGRMVLTNGQHSYPKHSVFSKN